MAGRFLRAGARLIASDSIPFYSTKTAAQPQVHCTLTPGRPEQPCTGPYARTAGVTASGTRDRWMWSHRTAKGRPSSVRGVRSCADPHSRFRRSTVRLFALWHPRERRSKCPNEEPGGQHPPALSGLLAVRAGTVLRRPQAAATSSRAFANLGIFVASALEPDDRLRLQCTTCNGITIGHFPEDAYGKGGKKKFETVFLVCEETGDYNYTIRRKPGGEKLKLKKYSPRLRKHTSTPRRRSSKRSSRTAHSARRTATARTTGHRRFCRAIQVRMTWTSTGGYGP